MKEEEFFSSILIVLTGFGVVVFCLLFFVTAPYGRHRREGWGMEIDNQTGWFIMEIISLAGFWLFFLLGDWKTGIMPYIFLLLWTLHYFYRSVLFPALFKSKKTMPVMVMVMAIGFNLLNSYIQGRYLFTFSPGADKYSMSWLQTPQFICGAILFFTGFIIHVNSDGITRNLRKSGEDEYKIPRKGLFRWISNPNYFGEIIQWSGWALLTWSLPGLVFAFWTFANLFPRAVSNHRWYRNTFDNYPEERRVIIPFLF